MTEQLRQELQRLADAAPELRVEPDTWLRGRRANRRARLGGVVAVLALALVVTGAAGTLAGHWNDASLPAQRPDGSPGVPSTIWGVPDHLQQQDNDEEWTGPVEADLALGRGSLAYVTGNGLPVLVTAADGAYHLLDLEGFLGKSLLMRTSRGADSSPLALSPDGRHLAWGWAGPAPGSDVEPMPSGIRVADLRSGEVREIPLSGGRGVVVETIVWSPDSRWLTWAGSELAYWTATSTGAQKPVAGRVFPGARSSLAVPSRDTAYDSIAVDSQGVVSRVAQGGRILVWDARLRSRTSGPSIDVTTSGAASPNGRRVAVGAFGPNDAAYVVDPATGRRWERTLPRDVYRHGAQVQPLGWVNDDLMVLQVEELTPESGGHQVGEPHVVVASAPWVPRDRWIYRTVARAGPSEGDHSRPEAISLAVDLMTLEQPTVSRPRPDWPWSDERKVTTAVVAAVGTALLLLTVRYLVRRRQRAWEC